MKTKKYIVSALLVVTIVTSQQPSFGQSSSDDELTLWYAKPGSTRIGNGRLGATVYGGHEEERIGLNHTWLWRKWKLGGLKNPKTAHHLPYIRKLLFEGELIEGGEAANRLLGSQKICKPDAEDGIQSKFKYSGPDAFVPAGDLCVTFPDHTQVTNYRRSLDLSTGVVHVAYEHNGIRFTRRVLVSFADGVIAIHFSANRPGAVSADLNLFRVPDNHCELKAWASGNRMGFEAEFIEEVKFAATTAVFAQGGSVQTRVNDSPVAALWSMYTGKARSRHMRRTGRPDTIVRNADEVLILISIVTDHESDNPRQLSEEYLDRIGDNPSFETLLQRHRKEYQSMFNRVAIHMEGEDRSHLPTDERLKAFYHGKPDNQLVALIYQQQRMRLMSCSQPGGAPAGLRWIWNDMLLPPWAGDIHHDDGFHQKYWSSQICNLPETAEPIFDYLDRCMEPGREAAMNLYGCRGIFIPLTNDAWARCLKTNPGWDEWTGAASWMAQHYWWQYEFHGDETFLRKRAYPFLKEVALFWEDYLVPDPRKDSPHHGRLVTVPSQSPENNFVGGIKPVSLTIGATSDFQYIHEVLTHCIEASNILGVDEDKRKVWKDILERIPPLQIGRHGQLQEWLEDYEESQPGHRHLSHLHGLFPGDQITLEETPEFAQACRVVLERRYGNAGRMAGKLISHGGFPDYMAQMWARLQEGELALREIRRGKISSAIVTEMLLQSHNDQIRLLPALPGEWPAGSVTGLRARGGFEVDVRWKDGALVTAAIRSDLGRNCRVRTKTPFTVKSGKGTLIKTTLEEPGLMVFSTEIGQEYIVTPRK
jgi:alpha-L-fucosidase 2